MTPGQSDEPILEIENLSIDFLSRDGASPAVSNFSCRIMSGEAMGLVGESGCGKTTVALGVMRDLGANGRIVTGTIRFRGEDLVTASEARLRELRGSRIAMVYQEPSAALNPTIKIGMQLVEVPMLHENARRSEAWARALELLRAVRLPDPERVMNAYPHQLSGGQQQRVVIAMALLSHPDLLLMDEPTTALDVTVEAGIIDLVKELSEAFGASMLFISHNLGLVLETCDRITVMYAGETVETGDIRDVFDGMRHPYTQGLFRSIPLPGADKHARPLVGIAGQLPLPHERPPGCGFAPRCPYMVEGRCDQEAIPMLPAPGPRHYTRCLRADEIDWNMPVEASIGSGAVTPGQPVLRVNQLRKHYAIATSPLVGVANRRTVKANERVDLEAREAETVAIVGESGCGKSTLAKVLLGLETATDGSILLGDVEIGQLEAGARGKELVRRIQMVFQNPFDSLNPSHTVGAQIMRVLKIFGVGRTRAERRARMLELLDTVKLPRAFAWRLPRQLSGGQKQRVGIARAYAGNPEIVVADEPVSALDVSVQAAVIELLMHIQRERRTSLIFISHDLSIVRYLADRVVVMYLGHVVEEGRTDQVFQPPYHPYTEALLSAVPIADTRLTRLRILLDGEIPSAMAPPPGCPFQTRCPRKSQVADDSCESELPPLREVAPGHRVRCHLSNSVLAEMIPVMRGGGR